MTTLARVLGYLRPYWFPIALAFLCLLLTSLIELYIPELIRQVIDCGIVGVSDRTQCPPVTDPFVLVGQAVALAVGLTVLRGVLQWGHGFLAELGGQGMARDIRRDLYAHLQRLSFGWHDNAHTGQLMARATSDVEQMRNFTGRGIIILAQIVFMTTGITAVLFITNWKLALLSLITLPLLIRTISLYTRSIQPLFAQVQEELAVLASMAQENIAGAKVVKAFAREPHEIERFGVQNARLQNQFLETSEIAMFTNPLLDVLSQVGGVIVLWFGGYLVITGELTVGQLIAFNSYLLLLIRPMRRLGNIINQASRAMAAGERVFEVLDAKVAIESPPNAIPMPPITGEVVFDGVWCSYDGGEPALRDVSFRVEPGQTVALLGATGSGKTSVVNLIPRFYDVSGGRVLVDGYDVRDLELRSLRRQIGMVLQDTVLFSGNIRENIAFGIPDASEERVIAAAKAARAHPFIMEFPRGYETRVGERGVTLSGGQRQRMAIARALLLDPRILILDDFTSAVDTETEALIREALEVLMRNRTTLVIAQRVSTVVSADQIIVMDRGQIAGMGTHTELIAENEIYREVYRLQLMDGSEDETDEVLVETVLGRANGHAPALGALLKGRRRS